MIYANLPRNKTELTLPICKVNTDFWQSINSSIQSDIHTDPVNDSAISAWYSGEESMSPDTVINRVGWNLVDATDYKLPFKNISLNTHIFIGIIGKEFTLSYLILRAVIYSSHPVLYFV